MKNEHIIFGTGPVGRSTAEALLKQGKKVSLINRSGTMLDLPAGAAVIAADASNKINNIELTKNAAVIYQCAQPPYYQWAEKFPALQEAILQAAIANQVKLVVADNLYMYGQFSGPLVEDAPVQPNTRKGRVRARMAEQILHAHHSGQVRAAIARASDFFGPYDFAFTGYGIQPAVSGKPVNMMGSLDQPHTFTYVRDFGNLLAVLGLEDDALGQVWFAPSNPAITQRELVQMMEEILGESVRVMQGGAMFMRFLGLFNRNIRETVEMMFEWTHPYVVDTAKAQRTFGLQPTPMMQALQETLNWCRTQVKSR